MKIKIIKTGSAGNAVIIGRVLIDCGVPAKELEDYIGDIDFCYITHLHSDHVNKSAVRLLDKHNIQLMTHKKNKQKRKNNPLYELKGKLKNEIWYLEPGSVCSIETITGEPIDMWLGILVPHNVPNYSLHMNYNGKTVFYCTDAGSLKGEVAKNYDYYLIEANYEKKVVYQIIKETPAGKFCRFKRSIAEHLSVEQATKFIKENATPVSVVVPLHMSSILTKKPNLRS